MFAILRENIKKLTNIYMMSILISIPHTVDHLNNTKKKYTLKQKTIYLFKGIFITPFHVVSSSYYDSLKKLIPED